MMTAILTREGMGVCENGKTRALTSRRLEKYRQSLADPEEKYAWKTQGAGGRFMQQQNPYENASQTRAGSVTGIAMQKDHLIYAVDMGGESGALYRKNVQDDKEPEGLLYSAAGFVMTDLFLRKEVMLGVVHSLRGTSHIARFSLENERMDTLTMGDTDESNPFLSADGQTIYYSAAGLARDENGGVIAKAPYGVMALSTRTGDVTEVLTDEKIDFVKFMIAADGTRYVLTRPHKAPEVKRANPLGCLLMPFQAIGGFIHLFAALNAARKGKTPPDAMTSAGTRQNQSQMQFFDGVQVDVEKAMQQNVRMGEKNPGIVPHDWQMETPDENTHRTAVRHGVVDFTLTEDGLIYSNGRCVIAVGADGNETVLAKEHTVLRVSV